MVLQKTDKKRVGRPVKDLTNNTYNRLTVLRFDKFVGTKSYWWCKCECGKEISVQGYNLKSGQVKSCGCLCKEVSQETSKVFATKEIREKILKSNGGIDGTRYTMLTDKIPSNNTTGVRGVTKLKNGKYKVRIVFKNKWYFLGNYRNIEDVAEVRKKAEKILWGDFKEWYETLKKDKREA